MHTLRQILRACFANAALIFLLASITAVPVFLRMQAYNRSSSMRPPYDPTLSQSLLLAVGNFLVLSPVLLTLVNGMAWWTLKTARSSARFWALAASLTFLLMSGLLTFTDRYLQSKGERHVPSIIFTMIVVQTVIGLAGLIAFGPGTSHIRISPQIQPARIAGDGTHKFVDALALMLQIGGTIWLMGLYTRWGYEEHLPFSHGLESWIQWIAIVVLVTFIHESAHAIVGIGVGMKLRAFVIGPFQFRVYEGRWKFELRPTQLLAFSGAAGLTPVNPDQSRWDEVAMIAAGPLSNLMTGALAAAMAYSALDHVWWPFWEYFALFATVSLVAGIVNLIPFRPESLYSDGARIVQLFRSGPLADYYRVVKSVQSTLVSQRRPRDYDIRAIERAAASFTTGHEALLLRIWAASCLLDRGNFGGASTALAEAERVYRESASDIPPSLHTGFLIKGTILGRDRDYIREWWQSMEKKKPTDFDQDYWLAKSAFQWAQGDLDSAREAWNTGQAYLAKLPDQGTYNYDRDCYRQIKNILDGRPTECVVTETKDQPETTVMVSGALGESSPA